MKETVKVLTTRIFKVIKGRIRGCGESVEECVERILNNYIKDNCATLRTLIEIAETERDGWKREHSQLMDDIYQPLKDKDTYLATLEQIKRKAGKACEELRFIPNGELIGMIDKALECSCCGQAGHHKLSCESKDNPIKESGE